jgi:hypothetical protein
MNAWGMVHRPNEIKPSYRHGSGFTAVGHSRQAEKTLLDQMRDRKAGAFLIYDSTGIAPILTIVCL